MKLKKLFAGVVAVAMMATMAMPSFAATGASSQAQTPANGAVSLKKTYSLVGVGNSPAETFSFTAEYLGGEKGATDPGKVPVIGNATYLAGGAATQNNTKDIAVDFSSVNYRTVGIYKYKITEANNHTAGVTYAPAIGMKVTVGNASDENTSVEVKSVSFWTLDEDGKTFKEKINGDDAFENTYTANTLTMTKTVKGDMGDKENDYFTYTLKLTGAAGVTYPDGYEVKGGTKTDNPKSVSVKADEMTTYTFKLKHGDSIYIENLPKDITWSVEETPTEGYTAYTEYGMLNKTQGTSYNGTTNGQEITAAFTNVKEGEIDTGVILDNAPYILMLAVVAGGAMTLVIKKRREEE